MNVPGARGLRFAGVLGLLGVMAAARADVEARRWLADMSEALAEQSYAGDFLHLGNGPVEKLRILHRVSEGHVAERLISLGTAHREVVRHDDEMQVILSDRGVVLIEAAPAAGSLLGSVPTFAADVADQYQVEFAGSAHVLGRPTRGRWWTWWCRAPMRRCCFISTAWLRRRPSPAPAHGPTRSPVPILRRARSVRPTCSRAASTAPCCSTARWWPRT